MQECLEFSLSYYEYGQIWLNILMDNRHFEHHHKIEKRKKKKNTGGEEGRGPGPKQGVDNEAEAEPGRSFWECSHHWYSTQSFLLRILLCSSKWHPCRKLFSHIWLYNRNEDRKKKEEFFYILGFLLEVIIRLWRFGIFLIRNLTNLGHFSHEKSFV